MTREEAITELEEQASMYSWQSEDINKVVFPKRYEEYQRTINAITLAIEMLNQQPCEDAISRQAAIDINEYHHGQMPNHVNHEIWKEIKALPSVTPHPKAGKWIYTGDYITDGMLKCSECGFEHDVSERFVYCPNCGKRMEVEE